jgi:two-component system response regulator HupR/HoxA
LRGAEPEQLLSELPAEKTTPDANLLTGMNGNLKERVAKLEVRILKETLIRNRWNKTRAADELGLSRVGLRSKLERYGLEKLSNASDLNEAQTDEANA